MTLESLLTAAYGVVGLIVVAGYAPQIYKLVVAKENCKSLSLQTWAIWSATGAICLLYALLVVKDAFMVYNMLINFVGQVSILCLASYNKYIRFRNPPLHVELAEQAAAKLADIADNEMYSAEQELV